MNLPNGTILDRRYRILDVVGEGGMGCVYKAENQRMPGPLWAIKELLMDAFPDPQDLRDAIERFEKESTLMGQLTIVPHPRLPRVIDRFSENGRYYFVMEFVPGKNLETILEEAKGPLPERKVVEWAIQVCEALMYIHSQKPPVILRDLKPGNIMVTPTGEVKLIDFGIARIWKPGQKSNTENLGTMTYASPEHLGQTGQTDARSDIYSLGATMYHLLTYEEPVPLDTPLPGSLRRRNPQVSQAVEDIVIKAMQLDPNRRFQKAEAMQTALQSCLGIPASAVISPAQAPINVVPAHQTPAVTPMQQAGSTLNVPHDGKICPTCGFINRPTAKFCAQDRTPLNNAAASNLVQAVRAVVGAARPAPQPMPAVSQPRRPAASPNATRAETLHALGQTEFTKGNYVQALNLFREALTLAPGTYQRYYKLGETHRRLGQLQEAADAFREAARLSPSYEVYFQIGLAERDLKHFQAAAAAFQQAGRYEPQNPAIPCQLGILAMEQHDYATAERELRAGLQQQSRHYLLRFTLGQLYVREKRWDEALAELEEAVQLSQNQAEAWFELGRANEGAGRYESAIRALEKAIALGLKTESAYTLIARCYHKTGNRKQARDAAGKALAINPSNQEAKRLAR
jgi:serine/threonine protein kinase/Flp pilus assembly protein TadD